MPTEENGETAAATAAGSGPVPLPARFFYFTRGLWNLASLGLALALKAVAGSLVPPWAYGLLGAVVLAAQGWRIWAAGFVGRPARGAKPAGEALVTAGPYARLRNPMYLGTLFSILAFAGMSGLWYAVLVVAVILSLVYGGAIVYEEAFLSARFGEEYRRYREAVPRIVPLLRARGARRGRLPEGQGRFRLADGLVNESGSLVFLPLFFALFWFVG
jgi:protein-S-isoprenylcysteine O-methyltransferase Ste14